MESGSSNPSDQEVELRFRLQKAQEHKQRGSWDLALSELKKALSLSSGNSHILLEIVDAYLQKGLQEQEAAFFQLAWHHCQEAVRQDPHNPKVHEQMIALGAKMKKFDELITQYKQWQAQSPQNPLLTKSLKQLETLSLMAIPERSVTFASSGPFKRFLLDMAMPMLAVALLLMGFMVKKYCPHSKLIPFTPLLITAGWILLGTFSLIKFLSYQAAKKSHKTWS